MEVSFSVSTLVKGGREGGREKKGYSLLRGLFGVLLLRRRATVEERWLAAAAAEAAAETRWLAAAAAAAATATATAATATAAKHLESDKRVEDRGRWLR